MNSTACSSRQRGFTLVEIMFVVLVVAILTGLAAFVIGRIKDRAVHSLLSNNLRQLYQAKEFYFTESGQAEPVGIQTLVREGYISASLYNRLYLGSTMESKMGWHYGRRFVIGEPTYAFQGDKQRGQAPTKETIYYPGPPSSLPALFADSTPTQVSPVIPTPVVPNPTAAIVQPTIPPPTTQQPPPTTQQPPPTTQTPAGNVTSGTTAPGIAIQPPKPPAQTQSAQGNTVAPVGQNPNNPNQPHSPGNSAFGHSHNQPHNPGHGKP